MAGVLVLKKTVDSRQQTVDIRQWKVDSRKVEKFYKGEKVKVEKENKIQKNTKIQKKSTKITQFKKAHELQQGIKK